MSFDENFRDQMDVIYRHITYISISRIVSALPLTEEELADIEGIGPRYKYIADVPNIIHDFLRQNGINVPTRTTSNKSAATTSSSSSLHATGTTNASGAATMHDIQQFAYTGPVTNTNSNTTTNVNTIATPNASAASKGKKRKHGDNSESIPVTIEMNPNFTTRPRPETLQGARGQITLTQIAPVRQRQPNNSNNNTNQQHYMQLHQHQIENNVYVPSKRFASAEVVDLVDDSRFDIIPPSIASTDSTTDSAQSDIFADDAISSSSTSTSAATSTRNASLRRDESNTSLDFDPQVADVLIGMNDYAAVADASDNTINIDLEYSNDAALTSDSTLGTQLPLTSSSLPPLEPMTQTPL
jgi:hypothetical protein